MKNKHWQRNSLQYKIKMWFRHLTFQDIKKAIDFSIALLFDIFMAILIFITIFILPAFFH